MLSVTTTSSQWRGLDTSLGRARRRDRRMISKQQRSGGRGLVGQTAAGSAGAGVLRRVWGERSPTRRANQASGKVAAAVAADSATSPRLHPSIIIRIFGGEYCPML